MKNTPTFPQLRKVQSSYMDPQAFHRQLCQSANVML